MSNDNRRPKLSLFGRERKPQPTPEPEVATRQPIGRPCSCGCGDVHQCTETFKEMVERCARERNGSIILHDAAES